MPPKAAQKKAKVVIHKLKKPRSTEGREEAKLAAKMTKEKWLTFQTEAYEKKWPKPAYMADYRPTFVRDGGEGAYRDQTYEIVTRWKAETKILYRPHAKAPGSKSHVRYEKYAKATTVAEALKKGSWPLDWCYDYEHGFIKVLGPVRDEPLDLNQHTGKLTDVDTTIAAWHRKELAKRYNLKLEDLYVDKGAGETLLMRCHRLVADRKAGDFLKEAERKKRAVTDEEVEKVLSTWSFAKNTNRVNVLPNGQDWVFSDTVGLLRDRIGDIHITGNCTRYPLFTRIITRWLSDRLPKDMAGFRFTSLNLNCNYAARRHRDGNNFGPSMIKAFGEFTGGNLAVFPEDDKECKDVKKLPNKDRESVDIKSNLVMFNGNSAHEVEGFQGNRYSIVYFTLGCHADARKEDMDTLRKIGFPVPSKDEDPHALLRAPAGYSRGRGSNRPLKVWNAAKLASGKRFVSSTPACKLGVLKNWERGCTPAAAKKSAAAKKQDLLERAKASNRWRLGR